MALTPRRKHVVRRCRGGDRPQLNAPRLTRRVGWSGHGLTLRLALGVVSPVGYPPRTALSFPPANQVRPADFDLGRRPLPSANMSLTSYLVTAASPTVLTSPTRAWRSSCRPRWRSGCRVRTVVRVPGHRSRRRPDASRWDESRTTNVAREARGKEQVRRRVRTSSSAQSGWRGMMHDLQSVANQDRRRRGAGTRGTPRPSASGC